MAFPVDNQRRWLEELRALRARHPAIHRIEQSPIALVEGTIVTAAGNRCYRLVYPPDFPIRPPSIWELREGSVEIVAHRAYGHAFADGSVCLFGHTPEDGWRAEFTGAFALDRLRTYFEKLYRGEFPRIEQIAREVPAFRVSISPRIAAALRNGAQWGPLAGWTRHDGRFILITSAAGTTRSPLIVGGIDESPTQAWKAALGLVQPWDGIWCRIDDEKNAFLPTNTQFADWVERHVDAPDARKQLVATAAVLVVQPNGCWFVFLKPPAPMRLALDQLKIPLLYVRAIEEDIPQRVFWRVEDKLHAAEKLRQCRVAIIGVGSLGSSIALALAKAGVGKFVLVDPQVLEPENVIRHVGGMHEIGLPKVDVVARAIRRFNPDAEVTPLQGALSLDPAGWSADTLTQMRYVARNRSGLLVCATATSDAERIVNAISIMDRCPAVFAAVLGRAEHGRVFRVLPGQTPCLQCIIQAQIADPGRFPRFDEHDAGASAYEQPGIPGLGMDIDQVALIAARLALQTLGEQFPNGIEYPRAHGDHFIWSNHGNWDAAVDGPLQARVERIARNPKCAVCGERALEPLTNEEEAELTNLLTF